MASKWRTRGAALAAVAVIATATGACGGKDKEAGEKITTTTVVGAPLGATEKEFAIAFDKSTVPAGNVTVTVKNDGKIEHELVAFKTDLPIDQLPVNPNDKSQVDEKGAGITHLDPEAEDVAPGKSKTITLKLTAGRYVFICNVPTHYGAGMRAELTVS